MIVHCLNIIGLYDVLKERRVVIGEWGLASGCDTILELVPPLYWEWMILKNIYFNDYQNL